jgi:hypothetical protein
MTGRVHTLSAAMVILLVPADGALGNQAQARRSCVRRCRARRSMRTSPPRAP